MIVVMLTIQVQTVSHHTLGCRISSDKEPGGVPAREKYFIRLVDSQKNVASF
jgi:hypothetical protein